jgi:hypothetical protein
MSNSLDSGALARTTAAACASTATCSRPWKSLTAAAARAVVRAIAWLAFVVAISLG